MIEIYDIENETTGGDTPCCKTIFDYAVNSFDFVSEKCLVVADNRSSLIIMTNYLDQASLKLNIATTKFERIKELRVFTDENNLNFIASLVSQDNEGKLALWGCDKIESWDNDLE